MKKGGRKVKTQSHPLFNWQNALSLLFAVGVTFASVFLFNRLPILSSLGYAGVFLISLLSSATIFIPLPGFAVVFAMGRILNPALVGIVAGIGAGLGESTGYFAGFAGHNAVEETGIFKAHKREIEKYGMPAIFILALIPNPAFDLCGIAAGAVEMPIWKFLLATTAGKIVRYTLLAYLGLYSEGLF